MQKNNSAASSCDELITAAEFSKMLKISQRTLWRLVGAGKIFQPIRIGRSTRWQKRKVQQWIAEGCPTANNCRTRWQVIVVLLGVLNGRSALIGPGANRLGPILLLHIEPAGAGCNVGLTDVRPPTLAVAHVGPPAKARFASQFSE